MEYEILMNLALIFLSGLVAQWLAWRFKLPSILLLLIAGFFLGPFTGLLNVDRIFGDMLVPLVSLSVAIILFEGGLSLNMADLKNIGKEVRNLLSIGIGITFVLVALSAHFFLKFDWHISILLSSILVVTGPTVIVPLLNHIRPVGKVGSILRWEGIVIDPIGVTLAVLIFEIIQVKDPISVPLLTSLAIIKTIVIGGGVGYVFIWIFKRLLKANLVPEMLHNAFALTLVVVAFSISNELQKESGLLTVTLMGILLASQRTASINKIIEFKENLQVLIISCLFIVLASRLQLSDLNHFNWNSMVFIGSLIFIIRPLSVFFSTLKSSLTWREKVFLMGMAPRGIVAAVVASLFAIELNAFGNSEAMNIVPLVFFTIMITVAVYGLTGGPLAYLLKLAHPNPQGILIVGGQNWALHLSKILQQFGFQVHIIDTNYKHITKAQSMDIKATHTNILAENVFDEVSLDGIGKLMALTPNAEVNTMATLRFASLLGRDQVYQLSTEHKHAFSKKKMSDQLKGRILFSLGMTYEFISNEIANGALFRAKKIENADPSTINLQKVFEIPLLAIDNSGTLKVFATDNAPVLKNGESLIYLDCTASREKEISYSE